MALYQSTQVKNTLPIPSANCATDVIPIVGEWTVPASGLVTGDIVEMAPLPADYVVTDVVVDADILGAAFTAAVGIMSGDYKTGGARTCGSEFLAAATYQAAAIKRMDKAGATRIAPTRNDRSIGFVISGVLTTPSAGNKVRLTAYARPMSEGA